jgi:hypothetical protein
MPIPESFRDLPSGKRRRTGHVFGKRSRTRANDSLRRLLYALSDEKADTPCTRPSLDITAHRVEGFSHMKSGAILPSIVHLSMFDLKMSFS